MGKIHKKECQQRQTKLIYFKYITEPHCRNFKLHLMSLFFQSGILKRSSVQCEIEQRNKCNSDLGSRFVTERHTDTGKLEVSEGHCSSGLNWKYQHELMVFQIQTEKSTYTFPCSVQFRSPRGNDTPAIRSTPCAQIHQSESGLHGEKANFRAEPRNVQDEPGTSCA